MVSALLVAHVPRAPCAFDTRHLHRALGLLPLLLLLLLLLLLRVNMLYLLLTHRLLLRSMLSGSLLL